MPQVSSPGAERTLRLPLDLERFAELPLTIEYLQPGGPTVLTKVGVYSS